MPRVVDQTMQSPSSSCYLRNHVVVPGAFEQPIQESLLKPVLHTYGPRDSYSHAGSERILAQLRRPRAHARATAHAALSRRTLLGATACARYFVQRRALHTACAASCWRVPLA
jgi:hypothetical protein